MRKCLLCLLVLLSLTLEGCGNDDENMPFAGQVETIKTEDGTVLKVRTDTACRFPVNDFKRMSSDIDNPNDVEMLKRFTDVQKDKFWMKATFGGWCEELGLEAGKEYLIRKEYYYQTIADKPGCVISFYMPENSKMGFVEAADGTLYIGYSGNPSADLYAGADGNCRTMIIYIGYDTEGKTVSRHYPCDPYELEWHYSWVDITDFKK